MLVSLCPIRADAMERLDTPDYKVAFYAFDCDIIYYETPTELSNALVNDEVDALANSYIRIPKDEQTIENFGETPYYIMARKVDQALIDRLDDAIDSMNVEMPNWRTEFYNKYYDSVENNRELTEAEQTLLKKMQDGGEPIRAVMNPDANPYSWYENGEACGIAADIFRATAKALELPYEIMTVASKEEYEALVEAGDVDIWMDMSGADEDETGCRYRLTEPYLSTTVSVLCVRGASEKIERLVADDEHISVREIVSSGWPDLEFTVVGTAEECAQQVLAGEADAALLMTCTAQRLARDDLQNRLRVDIVPGAVLELSMGINANDSVHFYGLWGKDAGGCPTASARRSCRNIWNKPPYRRWRSISLTIPFILRSCPPPLFCWY